ncbi:hypothetical protein [Saccharothrix stipae]
MGDEVTTTPYYYAGSDCSIVSFFPLDEGVRLTINMHITAESLSVVLTWEEFEELAKEATQISSENPSAT